MKYLHESSKSIKQKQKVQHSFTEPRPTIHSETPSEIHPFRNTYSIIKLLVNNTDY